MHEPETPDLPTSAALPAQSLTIPAVLVFARPSAAICSFHELEQLGSEGGASSSQLQLSGTHCHSPSLHIQQLQSVSSTAQESFPFTVFSSENYEEIELN